MNLQVKLALNLIWMIAFSQIAISAAQAQSGAAMLRIDCSGNNLNSEVYIDGVFRGECPVDIQVQEGIRKLRFYKKVDQRFERVQEQELRVGAATIKRIEILLPDAQLTAEAKREEEFKRLAEEERQRREKEIVEEIKKQERLRQEAQVAIQLQKEESQFLRDLEDASAGARDSKFLVGVKYRYGIGIKYDYTESRRWLEDAAASGHIAAQIIQYMGELSSSWIEKNQKQARANYEFISQFAQLGKTANTTITNELNSNIEDYLRRQPIFSVWYKKSQPWSNPSREDHHYMGGMVTFLEEEVLGQIFSETRYQRKLEKIISVYGDIDKNIFAQPGFFGSKLAYSDLIKNRSLDSRVQVNFICLRNLMWADSKAFQFHCLTSYTLLSSNLTGVRYYTSTFPNTNSVKSDDNPFSIYNIYKNGFKP